MSLNLFTVTLELADFNIDSSYSWESIHVYDYAFDIQSKAGQRVSTGGTVRFLAIPICSSQNEL